MKKDYYEVKTSEKTLSSAIEQETKTMLFLMGYVEDNELIDSFVIDVFNDVTATSLDNAVNWDAQSKGDSQVSPLGIGKDLVTLFNNYLSIIEFNYYLLSVRDISDKNLKPNVRNREKIQILSFGDFTEDAQLKIKQGLIDECNDKEYIEEFRIEDVDEFLNTVLIIINDDERSNYIKKLAFTNDGIYTNEDLEAIFKEIKTKQLEIKSSSNVNGLKFKNFSDCIELNRSLKVETINSLILSRIINNDIINKNNGCQYIPLEFNPYFNSLHLSDDEQEDFLNDCISDIYRMLTFKNMNKEFWTLLNKIVFICRGNKCLKIEQIYEELKETKNIFLDIFNRDSILYFISCIKGGLKNDN